MNINNEPLIITFLFSVTKETHKKSHRVASHADPRHGNRWGSPGVSISDCSQHRRAVSPRRIGYWQFKSIIENKLSWDRYQITQIIHDIVARSEGSEPLGFLIKLISSKVIVNDGMMHPSGCLSHSVRILSRVFDDDDDDDYGNPKGRRGVHCTKLG